MIARGQKDASSQHQQIPKFQRGTPHRSRLDLQDPSGLLARKCQRAPREGTIRVHPSAAKDRTFKTVRPNQGTAIGTVPIRRQPSL